MINAITSILAKGKLKACNLSIQLVNGNVSCVLHFEQQAMSSEALTALFKKEGVTGDDIVALQNALAVPMVNMASSGDELVSKITEQLEGVSPALNAAAEHYDSLDITELLNNSVSRTQKDNVEQTNNSVSDTTETPKITSDVESSKEDDTPNLNEEITSL